MGLCCVDDDAMLILGAYSSHAHIMLLIHNNVKVSLSGLGVTLLSKIEFIFMSHQVYERNKTL